jgi:uncharacterized protein
MDLAQPIAAAERIRALDAIRGLAVLGILPLNVWAYSMPVAAYMNPTLWGGLSGADYWAWLATHVLFDRKFMALFSMLFGAGVLVFLERAERRGAPLARLHYRRMFWLAVFGAAHAYLLWFGDILFSYAVCGLLLYPLRRLAPRRLLGLGLAVMAVASLLWLAGGLSMRYWPEERVAEFEAANWRPPRERLEAEAAGYRGGWVAQMEFRAATALTIQTTFLLIYELWRAGGLMLIGMALYKWGFLSGAFSTPFYAGWTLAGMAVGVPVVLWGVEQNFLHEWGVRYSFFFGRQWNYWASVPMAVAWAAAVLLALRAPALGWLMARLEAVGRTAFSNYILQTALMTTLFYGHGFGLYGRLGRAEMLGVVAAVWVVQLLVSLLWLRRFRFGPLEWAWRSFTYGRRQPFRLA